MPQIIKQDRVDLDGIPAQSMIPDGLAMNGYTRGGLPMRYYEDAVAALSWIRDSAGMWFPRWYVTPTDYDTTIAAYDTAALQHQITPGGVIFGWNIAVISGSLTSLWVQLVDPCSRHSVYQYFVNANSLRNAAAYRRPFLLQNPYQIKAQGLLDVQIRNNSGTAIQVQHVLHVAEPGTVHGSRGNGPAGPVTAMRTPR